ncbi:MAG: 16S rRNA (adenine(1518)-N(6)/adenine(1519)-N(6))-dimethyltransferase RsmA [Phycisphaerales bacterium]|nr:16S rRNA (adenine(1518)-N(6)/adenine(1519)-N(6))-dimethyltransferase RsmA [Phycisphaerales bacterium]
MSKPYTLKKSLGQHFLHDENMCKKIVAQIDYTTGKKILEIGPGGGAISKYLIDIDGIEYKAIEIDEEKYHYLESLYPAIKGKIILQDVLQASLPYDTNFSVIGNFPYNISSPIMFKMLEWESQVDEVIGMFQKEVAERIAAGPGSKVYGILSVLTQTYFDVTYLFDVPPSCFNPPPKVMSGVLRFVTKNNPHQIDQFKKFKMLVKAAFGQRRKTLRNALRSFVSPVALTDPLMDKRAEQLSVADFVYLYKTFL